MGDACKNGNGGGASGGSGGNGAITDGGAMNNLSESSATRNDAPLFVPSSGPAASPAADARRILTWGRCGGGATNSHAPPTL